jgi:nucleoside-diphosphate-sugar epimerase
VVSKNASWFRGRALSAAPLVLVTGANGFVGTALCDALLRRGYGVRRVLRSGTHAIADDVVVGDIGAAPEWAAVLAGVEYVVHLAARTHVMEKAASRDLSEYRRVNVEGTRRLAQCAARAGVRRFVFLSSIKVNGEETLDSAFREGDPVRPEEAYGITKWEAEDALTLISRDTAMETVILRPPLVYGPGVKGNFLRLMRAVALGVPLPLGSVKNCRSLIHVGNLIDAILACMTAPSAAGRLFLVSDGEDLSTPQLIAALGRALQVRPRLLGCPVSVLEMAGRVLGRSSEMARLTRSLQVDSRRIRDELGWKPPYTVTQGMADTARWYHAHVDHRARAV